MEIAAGPQAPSPAPNGVANPPFATIDPVRVVEYLTTQLHAALGAQQHELEAPGSLLSKASYQDTVQRCTRFAADTQTALYIQKELAPESQLENGSSEDRTFYIPWSYCGVLLRMRY
jgi:dynein heavy chain 1